MFLLSIFYVLNRHFIRPYIFKTINNDCILFVFGVLPNFVGVIIFLLLTTSILKMNLYYSLKLAFFYAIFIEAMYFFIDGIMYDFYDILSSLFAVGIMYVYYSFSFCYLSSSLYLYSNLIFASLSTSICPSYLAFVFNS